MKPADGVGSLSAISATGLIKRYGETAAVNGLSLEIPAGEFFGLLGPNGSGKTTTIHMLATLIRPSAGEIRIAGLDAGSNPVEVRRSIGLVFQESALDRTLTVAQNLRFARLLYNLAPRVIEPRAGALLELFGLSDQRNKPVAALSGGMRRALDIVRGVLHEPQILFLDEPTIGLDLPNRRRIWRFIEQLRARTGMTVLLTTHYLEEADGCHRVAFIRKGALVESGAPGELVTRLGRHVIEVESAALDRVIGVLEPELGPPLVEADTAYFRFPDEDLDGLARIQSGLGDSVSAWRVRRPNLNDVFLWVADSGKLTR